MKTFICQTTEFFEPENQRERERENEERERNRREREREREQGLENTKDRNKLGHY